MNIESIITQHPEGKTGENLPTALYEKLKEGIVMSFLIHPEIKDSELEVFAMQNISETLGDKQTWYIEVVKQDLIARDAIEYISGKDEKVLRLKIIHC